ncbi:MAG: ACP S-malonyltransferase [Candidatus Kapabacteria bacterium]|nr:ACP S-malonyltransferase [Candidatus Kapabacteria bacterium]
MSTAYLFSGQGSQYVGMTKDLVETFEVARRMVETANQILGYDLHGIMTDGPEDELRKTKHTQPALFLHESILVALTNHAHVAAVAGHSLGEFSALHAAGVLTFEDALRLVQTRAQLMFEAGDVIPGTMAAVVGLEDDAVRHICAELNGVDGNVLVPANFNSPGQVVISGSAEYVRACMPVFKERGAKMVKELQVSGAFHSPLLQEAQQGLEEKIRTTTFSEPRIPVYVNVSASPVTSAEALQECAIRQLTSPVLWTETINAMWADGIRSFCEVGPGKVLQGLVKRTLAEATIDGLDTASDVERHNTQIQEQL